MLYSTEIANVALILNALPTIASMDVEQGRDRPSKSQLVIKHLWAIEAQRTIDFQDWAFLWYTFAPVLQGGSNTNEFNYSYTLKAPERYTKILGFDSMTSTFRYRLAGDILYTDEPVNFIHVKRVMDATIEEMTPTSFKGLFTANLTMAVGITVKNKALEVFMQQQQKAERTARLSEANNRSSQCHKNTVYMDGRH